MLTSSMSAESESSLPQCSDFLRGERSVEHVVSCFFCPLVAQELVLCVSWQDDLPNLTGVELSGLFFVSWSASINVEMRSMQ